MSDDATVHLELEDAIAWISLTNANRMNAMTSAMWQGLPDVLKTADQDPAVRVIVLRGAGTRAFCAGADISEFESARTGSNAADYDQLNHAAFVALSHVSKPTIAMIHGFCLGGGLGLAACCDLRLADPEAQFSIPAAKLGIGYNPRWMTPLLALTSPANVKDILFTGRRIKAEEAHGMGLVNRVIETDTLFEATRALASEIGNNAPLSVAAAKATVNELVHHPESPDLYKLDEAVQRCFESDDYKEGRQAFLEKRKAKFEGR